MASNNEDTTTTDLLTPIGYSGAYRRTVKLFLLRWKFYAAVSLVMFPFLLFVRWTATKIKTDTAAAAQNGEVDGGALGRETAALFVEIFLLLFIDILAKGTMTVATLETYTKGTATTKLGVLDSARRAARFVCPLFCTGLLVEFIVWLSTVIIAAITIPLIFLSKKPAVTVVMGSLVVTAILVALVYVCVPLLLLYPVIINENTTKPVAAIRRCYTMASGRRVYLGCTIFLPVLLLVVTQFALQYLKMGSWTQNIVLCLLSMSTLPLLTILTTVVYMDLRVKREELTELGQGDGAATEDKGDETEITEFNGEAVTELNFNQVV